MPMRMPPCSPLATTAPKVASSSKYSGTVMRLRLCGKRWEKKHVAEMINECTHTRKHSVYLCTSQSREMSMPKTMSRLP